MKINTVWAVWFSGTDTTKKTVKHIADKTAVALGAGREDFDFTLKAARTGWPAFEKNDLLVFGTPTIAGRVPNVLLRYLETLEGGGALAVPVVLYGNRNYDDALIELRDLCQDGGCRTIAAGAFIGEHSFSKRLGAGRPDEEDFAVMEEFAQKVAEKAAGLTEEDPSLTEPVFVKGTPKPYSGYYQPRDREGTPIDIRKVKPKTDTDICLECGVCIEVCPMAAVDPMDVTRVPGTCIKCCACVKKCPVGAKYYDDHGYLYHQHELEEMYSDIRKDPELFY